MILSIIQVILEVIDDVKTVIAPRMTGIIGYDGREVVLGLRAGVVRVVRETTAVGVGIGVAVTALGGGVRRVCQG